MDNRLSAEAIVEKIKDGKRKKISVKPQYVVRASEVAHPCERYIVYSITRWQDRIPHGPEVEFIFEGGRMVEDLAIKDFEDAGFRVYRPEPDKAIAESKPRISGHIDIRVDFGDGTVHTGEINGLNMFDFNKLNTIQDFHNSKKPHIKKYPAQLMTYLYIKGEERGFFYLKSIPRFQPKLIWVELDLDYMESILQKTERIEKHIKDETLPPSITDYSTCEFCAFNHICLPDCLREGMQIIDDDELEDKLNRRAELAPLVKEYRELDDEIKKAVIEKERLLVGDYVITGKWVDVKGYTKTVEPSRYWKTKIVRLKPETEES
jgi:CRISPR/Cas system-associated exonuclease Cas4 (RecB family)